MNIDEAIRTIIRDAKEQKEYDEKEELWMTEERL